GYALVHGHYWLSGHVGAVAKERWGVPLVQSMHTLGKVKNAALARGDAAEPARRLRGAADVVDAGDRLVANTDEEARQLAGLYGADPAKIWTVNPGVDLSVFRPGPAGPARRRPRPPPARPPGPGPARPAPRMVPSSCSRAGSSRSRHRTWRCAPPPSWSATTRPWPG